jgi:aminomethyltransferase
MLNTDGGVIDDLYLYRLTADSYFLVINASMIDVDVAWMKDHLPAAGVQLDNRSAQMAGLALQGLKSPEIFRALFGPSALQPARNHIGLLDYQHYQILAARTGYTGEDGFEFFFPAEDAPAFWDRLLELGQPFGLKPIGLGARDTLRLEMGYPLNGNDLSPSHTPLEAGLGAFVSLTKPDDFPGKAVLLEQKAKGLTRKLTAFRMIGKSAPPRPHYAIYHNGQRVGEIASGTQSPSLGYGIGQGYLPLEANPVGTVLEIEIRGSRFPAEVVKKPFYKKSP